MLKEILTTLFERDLLKLKHEIELYEDESKLWIISNDIKNSSGNLVLHLIGNLQHFFGAVLGKTDYVRDRDAEFSSKNIPRTDIIKSLDETLEVVKKTIVTLSNEELTKEYPVHVFENGTTTSFFFVSLLAHLNYHLGQINYHRRLLS